MATLKDRAFVKSLLSIAIDHVILNLGTFHLEELQSLPSPIKNHILRRFLSTTYFSKNLVFHKFFRTLVNESTTQIDLTCILSIDDEMRKNEEKEVLAALVLKLLINTKSLESLIVMRSLAVNDDTLRILSLYCTKVKGLDLGGCLNVSDKGLTFLSEMELRWLRISRTMITDRGVAALAEGKCGQTLNELMIDNCVNVTDVGLSKISDCCPNLTVLNFLNCGTAPARQEALAILDPHKGGKMEDPPVAGETDMFFVF